MYKKKLLALSLAALFPLSLPLLAEEAESEPAESAAVSQPAESTPDGTLEESQSPAPPASTEEAEASAQTAGYPSPMDDMEARWESRNEHYEDLKKRAEAMGVILPEKPPWSSSAMGMMRPSMEERMQQHERMMSMTPQEMEAARAEHYQEMRERAKEAGVDLPETPPWEQRQSMMKDEWARQQAVIDGMTDEQRAACQAMHRRQMGMMWENPERPMMGRPGYGQGMGPGMGRGMGMAPGMMGPGYGYGPDPYNGQQNFWYPNQ